MIAYTGLGVDLVNISRFKKAAMRWGNKFLNRIFTNNELIYCLKRKNPYPCLAVRFAAKEAFIKAYPLKPPPYREIEIMITEQAPKPQVYIEGKPIKAMVSLSHEKDYAVAVVLLEE